ncbi:hypothetical protein Tco_1255309, partial [Tanacetum coccineum]
FTSPGGHSNSRQNTRLVRISQKSQENSQKRASTDTRIRRAKPKPEMSKP